MTNEIELLKQEIHNLKQAVLNCESKLAQIEAASATTHSMPEPATQEEVLKEEPVEAPVVEEVVPNSADDKLSDHLLQLDNLLKAKQVGVNPSDVAFLSKVKAVLDSANEENRNSRLLDILKFIDALSSKYIGLVYAPLQKALSEARGIIQECFDNTCVLLQKDSASDSYSKIVLPVSSSFIVSSGLQEASGREVYPASSITAKVNPSENEKAAWALVEEIYGAMIKQYGKKMHEDILYLQKTISTKGVEDFESMRNVLNYHTNYIKTINTGAAKVALQIIMGGLSCKTIEIATGDSFDPNTHSSKSYDYIGVQSDKLPRTVLGLKQVGLIGSDGLPIQKCIVFTSKETI